MWVWQSKNANAAVQVLVALDALLGLDCGDPRERVVGLRVFLREQLRRFAMLVGLASMLPCGEGEVETGRLRRLQVLRPGSLGSEFPPSL